MKNDKLRKEILASKKHGTRVPIKEDFSTVQPPSFSVEFYHKIHTKKIQELVKTFNKQLKTFKPQVNDHDKKELNARYKKKYRYFMSSQKFQDGKMKLLDRNLQNMKYLSKTLQNVPKLKKPKIYAKELDQKRAINAKTQYKTHMKLLKNNLLKFTINKHTDILTKVDGFFKDEHLKMKDQF